MANNTSNYKLYLEAKLDPSKIEADIKALQAKNKLLLNISFDTSDLDKLNGKLSAIMAEGNKLTKISIMGDADGGINKAAVEYLNTNGNIVKTSIAINKEVKITHTTLQDIAKTEAAIEKINERNVALQAKQADEMNRAALAAEMFLAKSKSMNQSPSVKTAIGTAQGILQAVSDKDIAKVRELTNEFKINKAALDASKTTLQSWTEGMKRAMTQTIEYGLSVGLLYGALAKLKDGLQFIIDLNKEMVKIQVLQQEGAQSPEEIAKLALQYNGLAKEMAVTTKDVAAGSVEWLRQGKSIAETQELLRATLMLSKLGALESAQATEYLTSVLNGYQMSAEDAIDVVNKLVNIMPKHMATYGLFY